MQTGDINAKITSRSGSNQIGVKQFNERLILDIISTSDSLSKADITRITGLSAQTVTTIVNRLINEGLLKKGAVVKGRVGQPSTLIELNNEGAFAIGIKIGRRSADIILVGLSAAISKSESLHYHYPETSSLFDWIGTTINQMIESLSNNERSKLIGIGVATPFELDGWEGVINAPKGEMSKWQDIDVIDEIEKTTNQPTFLLNDATAACLAELRLNNNRQNHSFLYYYVGTFLGGGVVVDGKIFNGTSGNAGSVGSLPTTIANGSKPSQMVNAAAIHDLEAMIIAKGLPRNALEGENRDHSEAMEVFNEWSDKAGNALAYAILSGQSFFDLNEVIIDGSMRRDLLEALIEKVKMSFDNYDTQGIKVPIVSIGNLANDARAIGGALLPIYERFGVDQSLVLKSNFER